MFTLYVKTGYNYLIYVDSYNTVNETKEIAEIYEDDNEFVIIKNKDNYTIYETPVF